MLLRTKITLVATAILASLTALLMGYAAAQQAVAESRFMAAQLAGDRGLVATVLSTEGRALEALSRELRTLPLAQALADGAPKQARDDLAAAIRARLEGQGMEDLQLVLTDARFQPRIHLGPGTGLGLAAKLAALWPAGERVVVTPLTLTGEPLSLVHGHDVRDRNRVAGHLLLALDLEAALRRGSPEGLSVLLERPRAVEAVRITGDAPLGLPVEVSCCRADEAPGIAEQRAGDRVWLRSQWVIPDVTGAAAVRMVVMRDVTGEQRRARIVNGLALFAVLSLVSLSVGLLFWSLRMAFRPLTALVTVLQALTRGDASLTLKPIRAGAELQTLSDAVEGLRQGLRARADLVALKAQLALAHRIQQAILPRDFALDPRVRVHARMLPAEDVGGDFYDVLPCPDGRLAVIVADVAGKGLGSALFASTAAAVLRAVIQSGAGPAEALARMNDDLARRNEESLFLTLFLGLFDPVEGDLRYANAGHSPPFLIRADGAVEVLPTEGDLAAGMFAGVVYGEQRLMLAEGELLLLYTDGLDEAVDPEGRMLGQQGAERLVAAAAGQEPEAAVAAVLEGLAGFTRGADPADDVTLLALARA